MPISNASRRGLIPIDVETVRRQLNSSPSASTLSPERRRAADIAAAEAELKAAMAAATPSDGNVVIVSQHPRCMQAIAALMEAITLDEDDQKNFTAYVGYGGPGMQGRENVATNELIKAMKRWPRIRKYWPRLRRRICWGCGKQYDLSEPRLWVCSECGEARYCDKACQRAHWPEHMGPCLKAVLERNKERRSQGEICASTERLMETYLNLYSR